MSQDKSRVPVDAKVCILYAQKKKRTHSFCQRASSGPRRLGLAGHRCHIHYLYLVLLCHPLLLSLNKTIGESSLFHKLHRISFYRDQCYICKNRTLQTQWLANEIGDVLFLQDHNYSCSTMESTTFIPLARVPLHAATHLHHIWNS